MIIDSHCHIDFDVFDKDRLAVLQRADSVGVKKIIVPGVMQNTWHKIKSCCEEFSVLYACYGLHPYFLDAHDPQHLIDLKAYIDINKPIAVGECGLDFFMKDLKVDAQIFYFEQQLDIALEFNLPVVIHARKSTEAVINSIKQRKGLRGMIHSYSGSYEQAIQLVNMGFYLSFGGPITYEKSNRLHRLVKQLPLEYLLVETDSPDQLVSQPAMDVVENRNEPAFIVNVVEKIADLRNSDIETISSITSKNSVNLFNL